MPAAKQFVVLANNLTREYREYFNELAKDSGSGIEVIPASINVFNATRPKATREPFAELFYPLATDKDKEREKALRKQLYEENLARIKDQPVTIIQSLSGSTGESFAELLVAIRTLKKHGAGTITVAMPYSPGRQDRPFAEEGRMASVLADDIPFFLKQAGADRIITEELHSDAAQNFFYEHFGRENVKFLSSTELFLKQLESIPDLEHDSVVFGAPDGGNKLRDAGQRRAHELAYAFWDAAAFTDAEEDVRVFKIEKNRVGVVTPVLKLMTDNVRGKHCVIVDDMGDSCDTLIKAATLLVEHGAASVRVNLTHWMGDTASLEKVLRAKTADDRYIVDHLTVTDTAPGAKGDMKMISPDLQDRVTLLETAPLFAQAIMNFSP